MDSSVDTVRFNLTGVPLPTGVDWIEIHRSLANDGVPCPFQGGLFRPITTPFWIRSGTSSILAFGRASISLVIGVELGSCHVLQILDAPGYPVSFVNSSILCFTKSVLWMAKRYPFYDADCEDTCRMMVANELRDSLGSIDGPCMGEDTFWGELYWDMANGDWSTADIGMKHTDWSKYQDVPPPWWKHPEFYLKPQLDAIKLTDQEARTWLAGSSIKESS